MHKNSFLIIMAIALLLLIGCPESLAQSTGADGHKFEIGGQFSVLNNSVVSDASATSVQCVTTPCPPIVSFSKSRKTQSGFGGRFGYNLTDNLALEAELNFFLKRIRSVSPAPSTMGISLKDYLDLKQVNASRRSVFLGKRDPDFCTPPKAIFSLAPAS